MHSNATYPGQANILKRPNRLNVRSGSGSSLHPREPAVTGPHIEREVRRGANYVRVAIIMTVDAADVARALTVAWRIFRWAAGDDSAGWDMAAASAEVRPEVPLSGA